MLSIDESSKIKPEIHNGIMKSSQLKKNDVLIAIVGATIGKVGFYDFDREANINQAIAGIRLKNSDILPKFIVSYLLSSIGQTYLDYLKRPVARANINLQEIAQIEIPVINKEKQKSLIMILDTALQNREKKYEHANKLLLDLPKFLMSSLGLIFDYYTEYLTYAVNRKDIIGRIDADFYSPKFVHFRKQIEEGIFPVVSIGSVSKNIATGFAAGKQDQGEDLPDEERVAQLRPFSITPEGELSFETQKFVPKKRVKQSDYCQKNEVLFNNTNSPDLVGKTTVFDSDVLCTTSNHITRITVIDGVNPYYVSYFFNLLLSIGYWKLLCTNFNNQAGVNTETLKSVRIPLPDIETQNAIVSKIMGRRSEANKLRKEAEKEWREAKKQFEKELLGE